MQHAVFAWLRLVRVFQKIESHSERLFRANKMSAGQFDVLAHVGAVRGMTQQELADSLLVTKGNVSQLLGKLERRGWIKRRQEGRANCLSLTSAGREVFDRVVPEQEILVSSLLAPLTEGDQHELLSLLRKLDRAISRYGDEDDKSID
ncbi:MAG TPA: MarR family winged helix-turn-helix transcriptional regulator [Spirochaetia bacterium]|nr:MarR family winged helix-turn-helix transcriptional regulator [Spirochaetia bacterium]